MNNVISNQLKNIGNYARLITWYVSDFRRMSIKPFNECTGDEKKSLYSDLADAGIELKCGSYREAITDLVDDHATDRIHHRYRLEDSRRLEIFVYPQFKYLMVIYVNYELHVRVGK